MALLPLNTASNSFPLNKTPYHSRVSTHAEAGKNYSMLAFNPGYALQAAELNEIQELFFVNQNLTQRMNANWIRINSGQTTAFTAPFWQGLIPLSPDYVSVTLTSAINAPIVEFTYTLSQGWYLYTDSLSKMSFWIWNPTTFGPTNVISNNTAYFGINVTTEYADCCQTDESCTGQDPTLRDASQSSYQEFTCGASRFKINLGVLVESYNISTGSTIEYDEFAQIFVVDIATRTIRFPNNYLIKIV